MPYTMYRSCAVLTGNLCGPVTESRLVLFAARQASKSRDEVLGQGIEALFRKPADREDGRLVSQRTILPELEFRFLLY